MNEETQPTVTQREPLMVSATVKAAILAVIAAVTAKVGWAPSPEVVSVVLGVAGVVEYVVSRFLRSKVTPNARVVVSQADLDDVEAIFGADGE